MQNTEFINKNNSSANMTNAAIGVNVRTGCSSQINATIKARGLKTLTEEQFAPAAKKVQAVYF